MIAILSVKKLSRKCIVSSIVLAMGFSPALANDLENSFSDLGPVVSLIETIRALPTLSRIQVAKSSEVREEQQTWIEFEYSSCAKRNFFVEVATEGEFMIAKVIDTDPVDCRAASRLRKYQLNLAKSPVAVDRVLILNSVAPTLQKISE